MTMKLPSKFAGVVVLTSILSGCYSYKVRPMPQLAAREAPVRSNAGGIEFGAKAYSNDAECKAVFNQSLCARGVLPVLLVIDNRSGADIEILRAACELETASGAVLRPIGADAASSNHGRNAMTEAVLFFGVFSYDNANRFNQDMARDWVEKGMGEVLVLRTNRTASNFLYFEAGKGFRPDGSVLRVPYETLDGRRRRDTALLRLAD